MLNAYAVVIIEDHVECCGFLAENSFCYGNETCLWAKNENMPLEHSQIQILSNERNERDNGIITFFTTTDGKAYSSV